MNTLTQTLRRRDFLGLLWLAAGATASGGSLFDANIIEAVTFAVEPGELYVPLAEAAELLGWGVKRDERSGALDLDGRSISPVTRRQLIGGTDLVSARDLAKAGAAVQCENGGTSVVVESGPRRFVLERAAKRVEINLTQQRLSAWQGRRLVLQTKVSTGRRGRTPVGDFTAGPYKSRMHYSSRYNNAPMPWSVQISGHVFIHGFTSVPDYPASHGCIRVPLTGGNPARFFYEWIDVGTPVRVIRDPVAA